jgi:hypothetical protein
MIAERKLECLLVLLFCGVLFFGRDAVAQDYVQVYEFPKIKPELTMTSGYGFVSDSGSRRAGKFRYLKDSPTSGVELVAFPLPHRIHFEVDFLNKNDYFADARYAYKDIILSRWLNNTVYHNLDNITLVDLNIATASPGVQVRDVGQNYWLRMGLNKLFLRLKTPDFPFHVYMTGQIVDKRGTVQKRFLGGSGYFNDEVRISQRRNINWDTRDVTVGVNSHFGPLEVDFSHMEKRFDASSDWVMTEAYTASTSTPVRPAGIYPHSLVPDTESSTNTLKVHTTYTGKIAASLTLSKTERDNRVSGTNTDFLMAAGDLRWMPVTKLTFTFKYRHKDKDVANPSTLLDGYYGLSTNPTSFTGIRPSISSESDTFSGNMRLRLMKGFTVHSGYTYRKTDRTNAALWDVSPSTTENTFHCSADIRVHKKVKLKGKYKYRHTDNPAYSTQPENAHEGRISLTLTPTESFMAFLSYDFMRGDSDNIILVVDSISTGGRDVESNRVFGNLTFILGDKLVLNTGYGYLQSSAEQGHAYGLTAPTQIIYPDVIYDDKAHNISASVDYSPVENVDLKAGINYTQSEGEFSPDNFGVASFTRIEVRETVYTASARIGLPRDWDLGFSYELVDLENIIENPQNPTYGDGEAHLLLVSLSKKW